MKYKYLTDNFESQISQAHRDWTEDKTETEVKSSLPDLYSRKTVLSWDQNSVWCQNQESMIWQWK